MANARREELEGVSVVAKFATTAADGKSYRVEHYNLDMVLSVGYRVKSPEGVHFRRWANDVLKRYVLQGVAINQRRLEQLGTIVQLLSRSTDELVAGVGEIVATYLPSLRTLRLRRGGHPDRCRPFPELDADLRRSPIGHRRHPRMIPRRQPLRR
ncbi:virulence RhuM family protein [Microbacterium sp. zg.B48]|uniref:virulence RhuM family protein n=1 Tax=Microbacterium sp. zg.B48 TaxID=2969408 RepID=UPI00214BDF33|nr:virulence RhuM family protein [Microbacterium sp. zg.B48]MCR2763538.1 virulence RhuM family protein [Microbacterium sp. zg.B48]